MRTREEVNGRLQSIMKDIHRTCLHHGHGNSGPVDYVRGANMGGFLRVAEAMVGQGLV